MFITQNISPGWKWNPQPKAQKIDVPNVLAAPYSNVRAITITADLLP